MHAMYAFIYIPWTGYQLSALVIGHHDLARSCSSLKLSIGAVMFGFTLFCFSLPAAVPLAKTDFMLALVQAFVLKS
jgi:hypothetical protein